MQSVRCAGHQLAGMAMISLPYDLVIGKFYVQQEASYFCGGINREAKHASAYVVTKVKAVEACRT